MDEKLLTPVEVAEMLQIKKNTVYDMIKRGDLKASKMGKQFRIAEQDVYDYLGIRRSDAGDFSSEGGNIVICGQDMLLDSLCAMFNEQKIQKYRAYRSPLGSYNGLYEMYQNDNYVATCHLWDSMTDTYNLPYVVRMLPGAQLAVFHLIKRWQGFYVKKGNPKNIKSFDDLTRKDVTMVNREKGSGIRVFFDEMLKMHGISSNELKGYDTIAETHLIAGSMVARGNGDVALGNEKTSKQIDGIDFIPLKEESYDIVFRKADLEKTPYKKLVELIQSERFRKEAEAVDGYNVTNIGKQIL